MREKFSALAEVLINKVLISKVLISKVLINCVAVKQKLVNLEQREVGSSVKKISNPAYLMWIRAVNKPVAREAGRPVKTVKPRSVFPFETV